MKIFSCVFAKGIRGQFGDNNKLPWKIKEDMIKFNQITTMGTSKNTVIMGLKTFESMGKRPLKNRFNIVLTSQILDIKNDNLIYCSSLDQALDQSIGYPYVIGGVKLLNESFNHSGLQIIYETKVLLPDLQSDVNFTTLIPSNFTLIDTQELVPNVCYLYQHNKN